MRVRVLCLSIAALPLIAASGPPAVPDTPVRVTVSEEVGPSGALYRYTVTNPLQSGSIDQFWVGHDNQTGNAELQRPPKGWTLEHGLPAESARSPKGWTAKVIPQEDAVEVELDYSANEARFALQPGQSAAFTVLVDKQEPTYTRSHWAVQGKLPGTTGGSLELPPLRRGRQD
jgi:hypothetical protein